MSFPFIDEQYNFAIGKYLTHGEILYDDIITNHQPVTHIFSALIQEIKKPNTTFSLLVAHRTSIIIWSSIWAILLVLFFGMSGFLFVIIYELTKSYMFGTVFLAETIMVYPFVFSVGMIFFKKDLNNFYVTFLGLILALLAFTLGPIWPALAFLGLILLFKIKKNIKTRFSFIILGVLAVILFVSRYTVLNRIYTRLFISKFNIYCSAISCFI